jgi:hypothetical protein
MATPLRLTKSRSKRVPLYSIDSRSGLLKHAFERTPKISIVTDAADIRLIPRDIRAIVRDERRIIRDFSQWSQSKDGSDACLVWLDGDRLLEGKPRDLLKRLHSADRRSFFVVNTPCLDEVPFLTIQPRIFAGTASTDYWSFQIRIENDGRSASPIWADSSMRHEPWGKLSDAVAAEKSNPGSGAEPLLRLWESRGQLPDMIGALVARNLVAEMLLHQENLSARQFLAAGIKLYPTYAELHYLAALLAVRERHFAEAIPSLERAKSCGMAIPGSGGENNYRCDWLLGVLAAEVGDDRVAFERFLSGAKQNPVFEPSLTELLKLRLPGRLIERHQHMFTQVARCNPKSATRIFEYLLMHRGFDAARRIALTVQLEPAQRESMENQLGSAVGQRRQRNVKEMAGIVFEGPFFEYSSLARVNREIAQALLSSQEFEVR